MFTGTIAEFATLTGVEYQEASGLYRFLKEKGIVKDVGKRPNKAGKGKPVVVFTCPDRVELVFPVQKHLLTPQSDTPHNASNNYGAADSAAEMRKEDAMAEAA